MKPLDGNWQGLSNQRAHTFTCGHCGSLVGPDKGWGFARGNKDPATVVTLICPNCNRPSLLTSSGEQAPGPLEGGVVEHVPRQIDQLYTDARKAAASGAFTSAVLTLRKILMHVAVEHGAEEGGSFVGYVEHLVDNGYLPPGGGGWLDYIRRRANEANHEIVLMAREDATSLLKFTENLLRHVFELPALVPSPDDAEGDGEPEGDPA